MEDFRQQVREILRCRAGPAGSAAGEHLQALGEQADMARRGKVVEDAKAEGVCLVILGETSVYQHDGQLGPGMAE